MFCRERNDSRFFRNYVNANCENVSSECHTLDNSVPQKKWDIFKEFITKQNTVFCFVTNIFLSIAFFLIVTLLV